MNPIYDFLRSDGSVVVNKKLSHAIGLHEAIIFSELISKYNHFNGRGQTENGYFYNTAADLEKDTTLSPKQQRKAIKSLEKLGLIKTHLHGVPAKRYFKIIDDIQILSAIIEQYQQFGKKVTSSMAQKEQLYSPKGNGKNTNTILKNNTNKYIALVSDDAYVSFFLSTFMDYTNREHPPVTEETYNEIMERMDFWYDTDYDEWCNTVIEYFQHGHNKPHLNHFLSMAFRLFNTGGSYDY